MEPSLLGPQQMLRNYVHAKCFTQGPAVYATSLNVEL
jgi:hypothetical protein